MAIDPNLAPSPTDLGPRPVIENEIPAYRAVSGAAVSSLLLGLTSLLCFADYRFIAVAAGAIVLGVLARRKIQRFPDILTGTRMAEVGIALGLIFSLSSVTVGVASEYVLNYQAGQFARRYVNIIKDEPLAMAVWYQQPPEVRNNKKPDEILSELQKTPKGPSGQDVFTEKTSAIRKVKDRLKGKGEEIHYAKVESKYADGLTHYINALIDLDGPGGGEFPEKEQFALLELIRPPGGGQNDWMVKDFRFPYRPASSIAAPVGKPEDGHGGHGH